MGELVDRRYGETDPTISDEDKMMERFAREKQRKLERGRLYNLDDEDEDGDGDGGLTHFGQSLSALGDAQLEEHDPRLDEEDAEEQRKGKPFKSS